MLCSLNVVLHGPSFGSAPKPLSFVYSKAIMLQLPLTCVICAANAFVYKYTTLTGVIIASGLARVAALSLLVSSTRVIDRAVKAERQIRGRMHASPGSLLMAIVTVGNVSQAYDFSGASALLVGSMT